MNNKSQASFQNLTVLVMFLVVVSVVGIIAGLIYFYMGTIHTVLLTVDFPLPLENNVTAASLNMTTFQDILELTAYPLLGLNSTLPYLTYFLVFGFIITLGMTAYLSSKNPLFFVLHLLFTILLVYFCIILSNMYSDLMSNAFINSMMLPFTIYNKIMLYLPQVVFFTSLLFSAISFINLMKPQTNASNPALNYGGDY